jgi:protein-S-isoprenylcysteine O-methyltransferase Ste14
VQLREFLDKQGAWLFRWRSFLPLLIVVLVPAAARDAASFEGGGAFDLEDAWELACVALAAFGLAVRAWTVGHVPAGTSGRNTKAQRADALNTTGLYSVVRNPLYVGNFFIGLGVATFVRCWWLSLIYVLLFALFYERIIFTEEEYLRRKFGKAWEAWAAGTPAFFPRLRGYERAALPFSVRNVLAKEYHVFFNVILAFVVVEVVEGLVTEREFDLDFAWLVALACGAALWVTVRVLKKTKLLRVEGR